MTAGVTPVTRILFGLLILSLPCFSFEQCGMDIPVSALDPSSFEFNMSNETVKTTLAVPLGPLTFFVSLLKLASLRSFMS